MSEFGARVGAGFGAALGWLRIAAAVMCGVAAAGQAAAQAPASSDDAVHLGVASCAGSTCHGAVQPLKGSSVAQNEYITWSRKDKHAKAYTVLGEARSQRIARNLGLGDARTAAVCLDCHADNVPPERRGPQFQISDGVGCEACHGGAKSWLGVHISGAKHADNLAAGMYPTDAPVARADKCLSCHGGDEKRFITHTIMGAGHPRIGFELDTYTAAEPAHFVIDKDYIARKGAAASDVRVWAVGQAVALVKFMDAVIDPKHAPARHLPRAGAVRLHRVPSSDERPALAAAAVGGIAARPAAAQRLERDHAQVIAGRVAPDAAKSLGEHLLALHHASLDNWANVQREARALRDVASQLVPQLEHHEFGRDDMRALADGVIAAGLSRDAADYPGAEQATMALASIVSEMRTTGAATESQAKAINTALNGLYESLAKDDTYKPEAFLGSLKDLANTLPAR